MARYGVLTVLLAGVICAGLPLTGAVDAAEPALTLYGGNIAFDVMRNGTRIGEQTVSFTMQGDTLTAHEVSDLGVTVLGVRVYHFHYDGTSLWRGAVPERLQATTNDDGKVSTVTATMSGGHTTLDGPAGHLEMPGIVLPGAHWDSDVLKQKVLLNSINGKFDHVSIIDEGADSVPGPNGKIAAHRFAYHGDLSITAWYDASGRWVGLKFKGSDGSDIIYVCRRCGPAGAAPR